MKYNDRLTGDQKPNYQKSFKKFKNIRINVITNKISEKKIDILTDMHLILNKEYRKKKNLGKAYNFRIYVFHIKCNKI